MIVMLYSVAGLLVTAGGVAVLYGADNIRAESGAAWLQSGATLAASGFILLALAAVLSELRKVRRGLSEMSLEIQEIPPGPALPPPPAPAMPMPMMPAAASGSPETMDDPTIGPADATLAAPPEPKPDAVEALPEVEEVSPGIIEGPVTVVGTYASGDSTYVMYSDGTIEAEMGDGRYRFPSMAGLRHFVDTGEGGEKIESPVPEPPTPRAA